MQTISLQGAKRIITGKAVAALRRSGKVPAVVYGQGAAANVQIERAAFSKVYGVAGESSLIDLTVSGERPVKVLIAEVQRDPRTGVPLHVDFRTVSMTEKLTAEVPLVPAGEAPAVKEQGGVLVKNLTQLKVECLPQDLVHEIAVPLAALKNFGDHLLVRDLTLPPGIAVLADPDTVVFMVAAPRSEDELKKLEEKVEADVSKVEVAKKEKKAEEGEEEAAPAAKPAAKEKKE